MSKELQRIILKGKLKANIFQTASINGDNYYKVPIEITEMKEKPSVEVNNSIMLIFWEKDFSKEQLEVIKVLKENQIVIVHGLLGGRENGLVKVNKLDLLDEKGAIVCSKACSIHCNEK